MGSVWIEALVAGMAGDCKPIVELLRTSFPEMPVDGWEREEVDGRLEATFEAVYSHEWWEITISQKDGVIAMGATTCYESDCWYQFAFIESKDKSTVEVNLYGLNPK
jgi:hypothetical protein